eukprot:CAMPEP_0176048762 /NCGR_PEP_ID=MMETSP0120_2-20121206/24225_1 /TAXON_ID=160619 /ORGANISM="Kryptoperidinium foliaceum, Strain CCMP 1326" /LENGTH=554 /DNA_ID=CAMNT_0017382183 /DNA_START=54 /DNA_END=1714 /DNA_ORIENTATION=-
MAAVATPPSLADAEQDDGCSIWIGGDKNIDDDLLSEPWAARMDKVVNLEGKTVRGCLKLMKQVATIGDACRSRESIEKLFLCGVDVFRLDFSSEYDYEKITEVIEHIRDVEQKYRHPIGILADLQGPKLECGGFDAGVDLRVGQAFRFDLSARVGDEKRAWLTDAVLTALAPGKHVMLDGGKVQMQVTHCGYTSGGEDTYVEGPEMRPKEGEPFVICEVTKGGDLSGWLDVDSPDTVINIPAISGKDRADIQFACQKGVDWITLGFVQGPEDMKTLDDEVKKHRRKPPKLLAKIWKRSAEQQLEEILALEACQGVIVALEHPGTEVRPQDAPYLQKDIIAKVKAAAKTVLVTTPMHVPETEKGTASLPDRFYTASMVDAGCDAVILADETARGVAPDRCVSEQRSVIESGKSIMPIKSQSSKADPIVATAKTLVREMNAKAIICFTESGRSVAQLVSQRVNVPILAVCNCLETARWLSLLRGVYATTDDQMQKLATIVGKSGGFAIRFSKAVEEACRMLRQAGMASSGEDWIVVIGRSPLFTEGTHNSLQLTRA